MTARVRVRDPYLILLDGERDRLTTLGIQLTGRSSGHQTILQACETSGSARTPGSHRRQKGPNMAGNRQRRFAKRKKEQERQAKKAAKRAKKLARSSTPGQPGDPEHEHVPVGPQNKSKASDQEVMAAIERAMNPGKVREREEENDTSRARLFVGNLDYGTGDEELRALFVEAGFDVQDAFIVKDRDTGDPRGFAFVEVAGASQAKRAIAELHGQELNGRELRVNAATPNGGR